MVRTEELAVPSNGLVLSARSTGEAASTLVMIHGGPGLSHHYMRPLEQLAGPQLRVLLYDQRGVGGSSTPPDESYSVDDYVADLEAIRQATQSAKIHLLGHSWGGLIAQAYAARYQSRVASLILTCSMAPWSEANQRGNERARMHIRALRALSRIPTPLPALVGDDCRAQNLALMPAYLGNPDRPTPAELLATECNAHVNDQTRKTLGSFDLRPFLKSLAAPSLVLQGEHDLFGLDLARDCVGALPMSNPDLVILPRVGHYPWLEEPAFVDEVRARIRNW